MSKLLLCFLVVQCAGAAVISSTQCTLQNVEVQTGPTSCYAGTPNGARASASVGVFGEFGISFRIEAITGILPGTFGPDINASAQASIERTVTVITGGPVRSGLLSLQLQFNYTFGNDALGSFAASFGPYTGYSSKPTSVTILTSCGTTDVGPFQICYKNQILPITLGVPIDVMTRAQITGIPSAAFGLGDLTILATLFEADGVTQVQAFDINTIPEPATWAMAAIGMATMVRSRKGKRGPENGTHLPASPIRLQGPCGSAGFSVAKLK